MPFVSSFGGSPLVFPRGGARIAPASYAHVTEYDVAKREVVGEYVEQMLRPRFFGGGQYVEQMLRPRLFGGGEYVERMLRPRLYGDDRRPVPSPLRRRLFRESSQPVPSVAQQLPSPMPARDTLWERWRPRLEATHLALEILKTLGGFAMVAFGLAVALAKLLGLI